MPYAKKTSSKYASSSKTSNTKRLKRLERKVNMIDNEPEWKYRDTFSTAVWTYPGFTTSLFSLDQGSDHHQREGDQVIARQVDLNFQLNKSIGALPAEFRVLLFWDMQTNSDFPNVFASVNENSGLLDNLVCTNAFLAPLNARTMNRYHVLLDEVIQLVPESTNTIKSLNVRRSINLNRAKIMYGTDEGAVVDITSRGLFLVVYSNVDEESQQALHTRVWFTDL